MKRLIAFAALLCAAHLYADSSGSVTVSTNSTIIIPYADASGISITAWATGTTYDPGSYARVSSARYWTPNGGTSTNQPTHIEGTVTYADGVTWQRITNADRRLAVISNNGSSTLWVSFGSQTAEVGKGLPLFPDERYFYQGQNEVRGIVSSSSVSVSTAEEDE